MPTAGKARHGLVTPPATCRREANARLLGTATERGYIV
jgi:hypothetical protein